MQVQEKVPVQVQEKVPEQVQEKVPVQRVRLCFALSLDRLTSRAAALRFQLELKMHTQEYIGYVITFNVHEMHLLVMPLGTVSGRIKFDLGPIGNSIFFSVFA